MSRYLDDLERKLQGLGIPGRLYVMMSAGGIATPRDRQARADPARRVGARGGGARGGAHGAARSAWTACSPSTWAAPPPRPASSTAASRCWRASSRSRGPTASRRAPACRSACRSIELIEIGAGGGSIARVDRMGLLKVGPDSAGADPGPACYGLGGREPTVTDADLVLGYLDADFFLGGRMRLDVEAARRAIEERVARPMGLELTEAAWGIHRVVNENMAGAARVHGIERGKDLRGYPLFAFGGAGPVHAWQVGRILRVPRVLVPFGAGALSAYGLLAAPLAFDFVRTAPQRMAAADWDAINRLFDEMEAKAAASCAARAWPTGTSRCAAPPRCATSARATRWTWRSRPGPLGPGSLDAITAAFEAAYRAPLQPHPAGRAAGGAQLARGRSPARARSSRSPAGWRPGAAAAAALPRSTGRPTSRRARGYVETPVYDRYALGPGRAPRRAGHRRGARVDHRHRPGGGVTVDEHRTLIAEPAGHGGAVMDPITLDICWNRLIGVVNEQAAALMRTSFTSIVREAGDLSAGVFDRRGYMIAQAVTGTPGHINSMALAMQHFLAAYPLETLRPGDVLITNDPWKTSGHLNDVTVCTPIFRGRDCVAFFGNTCHSADIGGRVLSAEAREVYEEGLFIPIMKLYEGGPPQRGAGRDHPGQRPRPRPGHRRPPRAGGRRRRRGRAPARVHGRVRPRAPRAAGRRDHRPHRAGHARGDRARSRTASTATRSPPTASTSRSPSRCAVEVAGRRSARRLRRLLAGEPARHQRGDELHRGLHDLRAQGHRQPRRAEQRGRLPAAPHHRARGLHPQRAAARPRWPPATSSATSCPTSVAGALAEALPDRVMAEGSANIWSTQLTGKDADRRALRLHLLHARAARARAPARTGSPPPRSRPACSGTPVEVIETLVAAADRAQGAARRLGRRRHATAAGSARRSPSACARDEPATARSSATARAIPAQGFFGGRPAPGQVLINGRAPANPKASRRSGPAIWSRSCCRAAAATGDPAERDPGSASARSAARATSCRRSEVSRPADLK